MSRLRWPDSTNSVSEKPGTIQTDIFTAASLSPDGAVKGASVRRVCDRFHTHELQCDCKGQPYTTTMTPKPTMGMSRTLLKLSGSLVHDYATIPDDSPSPNRASRARRAATSAGIS